VKIWAYVIGLSMISALLGYGVHVVRKASRVDAAEARATAAEKGRADDMAEIVKRLDADARDRKAFVERFDAIDRRFADIKIPEPGKLILTKEIPGEPCARVGVGLEFVGVWNTASLETGDPASKAR
jgi:hypothetical protein